MEICDRCKKPIANDWEKWAIADEFDDNEDSYIHSKCSSDEEPEDKVEKEKAWDLTKSLKDRLEIAKKLF